MSRRTWLLFAAMGVLWGLPYLLIRVAVRDLDPAVVVMGRTALAAVVLLPLALRRRVVRDTLRHWRWLAVYTVVEVALPWLLLTEAEERLTSSLAGLLVAVTPLLALLVNRASGGAETVDARRVAGLVVGLGGVVALVGLQVGHVDLVAVAAVVVVASCYAVGPIVASRRLSTAPSLGVVTVSLAVTALGYAPYALTRLPGHVSGAAVASLVGLGLLCTAAAFLVFFALMADVGPSRAVVVTYVNPAVALVLGVTVLGEPFTVGIAVGFPLVLLGSVLATMPGHQRVASPVGSAGPPALSEEPAPVARAAVD